MTTELNPFPAAAVARLSPPEAEFWSIETEALKQARGYLQDYLKRASQEQQQPDRQDTQGIILAIVGDYGTGKTHIAQDMLRQIAAERNPYLHPLYLDAPSDTFLALYQERFLKKLDRSMVLQRVDEYYADIVADELGKSDLTKPVAEALRNREVSADEVVRNFGLIESQFVRKLDVKLKFITEQSDFGTALLLLRRPEFQAAVWEWLEGSAPDPILQERGITRQIDNDAAALEAVGVMAFLFGHQRHRFILFIDEIEKVLSHTAIQRPDEAAILALKKLMESMSKTRALLVLIGLPEFQDFLPEDARQRITSIIRPSAVSSSEIAEYVREANKRATNTDSLHPFTDDTIDYLSEIAGGNTRKMVRLCYHAYHIATTSDSSVTRPMLREIARDQFESTKTEDVTAEISRLIEARGWLYEKGKVFGTKKSKRTVDFWLPIGEEGAGIALWVTRSVLQESDVSDLVKRISTVASKDDSGVKVDTVLVINGYLADNLRAKLENSFGRVLVYRLRSFREDLESILLGMRVRLEQRGRENIISAIKLRVDEIARQHRNIDNQLSVVVERGIGRNDLQSAISSGLRAFFGQLASSTNTSVSEANYPRIAAIFDTTQRVIDDLIPDNNTFDLIFGFPQFVLRHEKLRYIRRSRSHFDLKGYVNDKGFNDGLAQVLFIKNACLAFRRGVFMLLDEYSVELRNSQLDTMRSSQPDFYEVMSPLETLCRTFDDFASTIDLISILNNMKELNLRIAKDTGLDPGLWSPQLEGRGRSDYAAESATREIRELAHSVWVRVREEFRM